MKIRDFVSEYCRDKDLGIDENLIIEKVDEKLLGAGVDSNMEDYPPDIKGTVLTAIKLALLCFR